MKRSVQVVVRLKIVLVCAVVFSELRCAQSQTPCETPDGKAGQCIVVKQCKTVVDFIQQSPKPIKEPVAKKLNEYAKPCGYYEDGLVRVCCPAEPIVLRSGFTGVSSAPPPTPPPPPPDITGHKSLTLLPEECGLIDIGDKIRNGQNAELREFPWMAQLAYTTHKGRQFKCGGSVINERYILTAAHCLVGTPYPVSGVRVGEYDVDSEKDCDNGRCLPPVQDLEIEKLIVHLDYNKTLYSDDIALIRVSKMNMNAGVAPICLPTAEELRDLQFTTATVTGWGYTDPSGKTSTGILQKVVMQVQNLSTCIEAYKVAPQVKISYKQWCVGGIEEKDSCGGDSGGPLQVPVYFNEDNRYVQHGIVSIGHSYCGTDGFPGLYTKVSYYMPWVLDNIES